MNDEVVDPLGVLGRLAILLALAAKGEHPVVAWPPLLQLDDHNGHPRAKLGDEGAVRAHADRGIQKGIGA